MPLTIAVAQPRIVALDIPRNARTHAEVVEAADARPARRVRADVWVAIASFADPTGARLRTNGRRVGGPGSDGIAVADAGRPIGGSLGDGSPTGNDGSSIRS